MPDPIAPPPPPNSADQPAPPNGRPNPTSRDDAAPTKPPRWKTRRKWLIIVGGVVALVAAGLFLGWDSLHRALTTESTDDAFLNSHISSVSGRINGQVVSIYYDDNDRVKQGDLLVEIDHIPYQLSVDQKRAQLRVNEANLASSVAQARSQVAKARSSWYSMIKAQEQVRAGVATVRADVTQLNVQEAQYKLDTVEVDRVRRLVEKDAAAKEELDQKMATVEVDRQNINNARETIRKDRASIGLGTDDSRPLDFPKDLEQTNSAVQSSLSDAVTTLAQLGLTIPLSGLTPDGLRKYMEPESPGDSDRMMEDLVQKAPSVQQARASVEESREDLRSAELDLKYTYILAPIDGQVAKRSVNVGDNVQTGQAVLSVRSQADIWIDANFKETQLRKIAIGHPVEFTVDAYPKKVFRGRVEGFGAGTGAVQSVLPPENATGNFVKIVQRLTIRIRVNADDIKPETPLFAGLSVIPRVKYEETATGPNAGRRLLDPGLQREPNRTNPPSAPRPESTANAGG